MTGIQVTHDADGEDDEFQLHLELGETPPPSPLIKSSPASTVATYDTYDTYLLPSHNLPNLSRAAEGHPVDEPQDCSHEPEPSNSSTPISLNFIWDYFDNVEPTPKVMAAQAVEALNRTFIELKSKNEETRLRASYELRDQVVSAARGKVFCLTRSSCIG